MFTQGRRKKILFFTDMSVNHRTRRHGLIMKKNTNNLGREGATGIGVGSRGKKLCFVFGRVRKK